MGAVEIDSIIIILIEARFLLPKLMSGEIEANYRIGGKEK